MKEAKIAVGKKKFHKAHKQSKTVPPGLCLCLVKVFSSSALSSARGRVVPWN